VPCLTVLRLQLLAVQFPLSRSVPKMRRIKDRQSIRQSECAAWLLTADMFAFTCASSYVQHRGGAAAVILYLVLDGGWPQTTTDLPRTN
jgi:hypothetical protein